MEKHYNFDFDVCYLIIRIYIKYLILFPEILKDFDIQKNWRLLRNELYFLIKICK